MPERHTSTMKKTTSIRNSFDPVWQNMGKDSHAADK